VTTSLKPGWGNRKDIQILIIIVIVGIAAVIWALWFRAKVHQPAPGSQASLPGANLIALRDRARGPATVVAYSRDDLARVTDRAVAEMADGEWRELPANSVLRVTDIESRRDQVWVHAQLDEAQKAGHLLIHASFLEPYRPVVLNQTLEISGVKFLRVDDEREHTVSVSGWLRNITPRSLSQCLITCVFQDSEEHEVDNKVIPVMELPPGQLYQFQTLGTTHAFAAVSIQITYVGDNDHRVYLNSVTINRSVE
jgi:hypothetical protein